MTHSGGGQRFLLLAFACLLVVVGAVTYFATRFSGWNPPADPAPIASSHFQGVRIAAPAEPPIGLAAIVSDSGGTGDAERALGESLRQRGFIVLQLDLEQWRVALDNDSIACIRPIVDVELLAKEAQRALGVETYLRPVLVGIGEGGTLTEAILSRTYAATLGGGVAVDPAASLATTRPICDDGAPVTPGQKAGNGFTYPVPAKTQAALSIIESRFEPDASTAAGAGPFTVERRLVAEPAQQLPSVVDAAVAIATQDAGPGSLPVIDLPAKGTTRAVALFISGDGGWRDIDKQIGEQLTQDGVHVLGVDALRYYWNPRDPKAAAADFATMLRQADPGGTQPILVLGYSFGADLFPFSWPSLPAALKDRVRLIALLGPNRSTGFSVSVKGWLGFGGEHAVVPRIAEMPLDRVLCVHGSDETASACTEPSLSAARTIQLEGGHHFDRDYPAIARLILKEAGLSPTPRETP